MTERIINPTQKQGYPQDLSGISISDRNPTVGGPKSRPIIFEEVGNFPETKDFTIKATRDNLGKLEWSLPDYQALEPLIRVMMWGKTKYGRDNWKKGFVKEELTDSLLRHTLALQRGEEIDPDTGESHVGGVLFNAMCFEYCRVNNKFV